MVAPQVSAVVAELAAQTKDLKWAMESIHFAANARLASPQLVVEESRWVNA